MYICMYTRAFFWGGSGAAGTDALFALYSGSIKALFALY
jgi:hypothetical protein